MSDSERGLRQCHDCGELKPLSEFHASPRRAGGRGSYCKPCFNVRSRKSYARRFEAKFGRDVRQRVEVPEGHRYCPDCEIIKPLSEFPRNRSGRAGYGAYCKSCHDARGRATVAKLGGSREYHLNHRYGIGEAELRDLLAAQGGVCAICGAGKPEHVDHDHRTGYVRGILCFNCNAGLGKFRNNVDHLTRAAAYVWATDPVVDVAPGVFRVRTPDRGMFPARRVGARRREVETNLAVD